MNRMLMWLNVRQGKMTLKRVRGAVLQLCKRHLPTPSALSSQGPSQVAALHILLAQR